MINAKKHKLLTAVLFLIVLLQSGHALQTIIPSIRAVIYIPAIIALLYIAVSIGKERLKGCEFIALTIFTVMIICTMIIDMGKSLSFYINMLCILLGAYCISSMYSFKDMVNFYLKFMTVTSIIALIGYYLVNNTTVLDILPRMENVNDVEYGVGIVFNFITAIPERNCGMFWEPGLFATHLIISLIFEMTVKDRVSWFRLILFSVCIFTANSSAGFALWFLCVIMFFVRKARALKPIKSIFSCILLIGAVAVVVNFDIILAETALGENEYFQKLYSDNVLDSSRTEAIFHNFKLFSSNPVFGAGHYAVTESIANIHVGDTSTTMYMMSVFGILGSFFTGLIVYGIFKKKNINLFSKILITAIAIIIINKEPHHSIYFTWILIFYLVKNEPQKDSKLANLQSANTQSGEGYEVKGIS